MSGDIVRIMAVNDSTTVTIGNGTIFTLDAAQFVELDIPAGDYIFIESDKVRHLHPHLRSPREREI